MSVTAGPAPPITTDWWSTAEWWAFGDSLFAGHSSVPGAPSHLRGVVNAAAGGTTLVPVTTSMGNPNGDLAGQISAAIERAGRPRHVIISAGMADLYARQVWGADLPLASYTDRYVDITQWLRHLGIDVHWMTITPITSWGIVGAQAWLQSALNAWLRSSGLPLVDCESSLQAPGSPWLDDSLTFALDGVHLNETGSLTYARCISAAIGVPLTTDPVEPDPPVPDTTAPDPSVPDPGPPGP
ncbi:SGNH/GDSL hydrolase family protein [Dermatobacter hominis]|uniref:SGNH/GDSL hydrolase family protein n=1 Tax=Dermatobacter hominis TaxID=2884263 RepID=UPI001D11FDAC|nr:SGNH/GDSL hydrolase family protein [Dermatobacter hominis]UDY37931.1 SGNH/GDSL hydrolase family protein [Dermatobacter hominis]